ncbi:MAG: OmpA family protein, partial [Cyclobacteriaceae bacterium]|nr:OmpA family protein [Cyclobacteriaceae bacterium]
TGQKIPGELMTLELPLGSLVTLNGQVLDATSMEVLSDALVSIVNESTGEEQEIRSNQQGRFQIQLPKNQRYSLVGKHGVKTGMVMGYQPGNSAEDSLQLLLEHQVLAMEDEQIEALDDKAKTTLLGNGVQITGPIEIENIYYEFDRWEIGTEAAQALDKLVQVMIENPSLKIELSSHTDVRGTESYNQHLSQKRAQSAVAYMVTRGINQRRLTSKGYGESKLLNNCLDEFDCNEEQHQENRRTEFMVLEF